MGDRSIHYRLLKILWFGFAGVGNILVGIGYGGTSAAGSKGPCLATRSSYESKEPSLCNMMGEGGVMAFFLDLKRPPRENPRLLDSDWGWW